MQKNALILTGSFGEGHKQVASAILKTAELYQPSMNIQIVDFISWSHPALSKWLAKSFIYGVKNFPKLYGHFYQKSNHVVEQDNMLKKIFAFEAQKMALLIHETRPSVIICSLPYMANIIAEINDNHIPVVTIITDFAVHSAWIHPKVDLNLVGSKLVQQQLIDLGVDSVKIKCTGIPVKLEFTNGCSRKRLALKNNLQTNLPTILIMGGGYGMMEGNAIIKMIREFTQVKLQVIVICGYNKKLKARISKELKNSKHNITILGYVNNVHEFMQMSDLIVTKSGGVTVSESLATALPMLLLNPIPGQEQKNAMFLVNNGAAVLATNQHEATELLNYLLQNPSQLMKMKSCAEIIASREAAKYVIHEMNRLIKSVNELGQQAISR